MIVLLIQTHYCRLISNAEEKEAPSLKALFLDAMLLSDDVSRHRDVRSDDIIITCLRYASSVYARKCVSGFSCGSGEGRRGSMSLSG